MSEANGRLVVHALTLHDWAQNTVSPICGEPKVAFEWFSLLAIFVFIETPRKKRTIAMFIENWRNTSLEQIDPNAL